MYALKATVIVMVGIFSLIVPSSSSCPDCAYYILGVGSFGNQISRGNSDATEIEELFDLLVSLSYDMVSGSVACSTYPDDACSPNGVCTPGPSDANYFSCQCKDGAFTEEKTEFGFSCIDIDECGNGTLNDCHEDAVCTNLPGTFDCTCPDGFTGNGTYCADINECEEGVHKCSDSGSCNNTKGSYTCFCYTPGYTWNGENCVDKNECLVEGVCGQNMDCINSDGSFYCQCKTGFNRTEDGSCIDIDECTSNAANCEMEPKGYCENTEGSFLCFCGDGFTGNGVTCEDIDECSEGLCSNGVCDNYEGGYNCTCNDGYEKVGQICERKNYCANESLCRDANCRNIAGGYECYCQDGFQLTAEGYCDDIDECENSTDYCSGVNERCVNNVGSYNCSCSEGYARVSEACVDIDECDSEHSFCENGNCTNAIGSFTCECNEGYEIINGECVDIDECEKDGHMCDLNAGLCFNTPGSYVCECEVGWTLNIWDCEDVDECVSGPCHANAHCTNTPGSYNCTCNTGFVGNGFTCGIVVTTEPPPVTEFSMKKFLEELAQKRMEIWFHGASLRRIQNMIRIKSYKRGTFGRYWADGTPSFKPRCV